jgi:hypothetical protein
LQVGDTGPVESARRSNSRVLGSPFSGLSGQSFFVKISWISIKKQKICDGNNTISTKIDKNFLFPLSTF